MFDKSKLIATLGDHSRDSSKKKEILTNVMYNPDFTNRINIIAGVTDEIPIANALIGDPTKPIKDSSNITYKENVIELDAEKIKTQECMVGVKVVPTKLWNTWLTVMEQENKIRSDRAKKDGIPFDPFKMPFEEFFLGKIVESAQSAIYNKALFRGVRDPDGTDASSLFDGFMTKIDAAITATKVVEKITGEITVENVLKKLYDVYDSLGEEVKNNTVHAHLPSKIFDMLARTFTPTINTNIVTTYNPLEGLSPRQNQIYIPGTNAIAFREPGMGNTNQVIFTEPNNLHLGYSVLPGDIDLEVQKEDLAVKYLLYFKAGAEIGKIKKEFGALAVNEAIPSVSE